MFESPADKWEEAWATGEVIVKKKRPIQYVIPLRADDRQRAIAG